MSERVNWPIPLERATPFYPGQMGVPGSDVRLGIRTSTEGAVFYVDPNVGNDSNDGTDPMYPLATVTKANSLCQDFHGDVIAVGANGAWQYGPHITYPLALAEEAIITKSGIRLVGVNPGSCNGVLWTPTGDNMTMLTIHGLDVCVEGFIFSGNSIYTAPNAIRATWAGATTLAGDNLTVKNCVFESTVNIAIELDYVWYAHIYNNRFWFTTYGIYANPAYTGCSNLDIHDNIFHECAKAMLLTNTDYSHIYRNSIFNDDARHGINATDDGITLVGGRNNMVFDNTFPCLLARLADFCSSGNFDAWTNNHCLDGLQIAQPA